jgi:hypothetical protein
MAAIFLFMKACRTGTKRRPRMPERCGGAQPAREPEGYQATGAQIRTKL